jgi:hypothetical protein
LRYDQGIEIRSENLEKQGGQHPITISHGKRKVPEWHLSQVYSVSAFPGEKNIDTVWIVKEQWYEAEKNSNE